MIDPQEAWILSNTFYCPRLKIKLTPEKCNDSRKNSNKKIVVINGVSLDDNHPHPCGNCKDWKTYSLRVGKSNLDEEEYRSKKLSTRKNKLF